jgi:hypothetical protein
MANTVQPEMTLADWMGMTLEELQQITLGQMQGDARDTKNGFEYNFSVDVSRVFTSTVQDVTRS